MSKYLMKVRRDAISLATQPDRWYQSCVLLCEHAAAAEALLVEAANVLERVAERIVDDGYFVSFTEPERDLVAKIRAAVGAKEGGHENPQSNQGVRLVVGCMLAYRMVTGIAGWAGSYLVGVSRRAGEVDGGAL